MSTTRPPGQRTDGITKLKGSVTFATDGVVSIDLTVDDGSMDSTSSFKATGAPGDTVASNATEVTATPDRPNSKVTAAGLPKATASTDYTAQVSYTYGTEATRRKLKGTVPSGSVVFGTTAPNVSLS